MASDDVATDVAELRDIFAAIGLDDSAKGNAADAIRAALAEHNTHLAAISAAAHAVTQAVSEHRTAISTRDAETPTDDAISAAQQAVIDAADAAADGRGSSDQVQSAVDRLADLLAEKQAAQSKFETAESAAADTLNSSSSPLSPETAAAALSALTVTQNLLRPLLAGSPQAAAPMAATPATMQPSGEPFTLADALLDDDTPTGRHSAHWGDSTPPRLDVSPLGSGAGQTHVASDLPDPSSVTNVSSSADVSGRAANTFTPTSAPSAAPSGSQSGMMPYAPTAPMGQGGSSKPSTKTVIVTDDPDFTGDDIDIATSGVIGRE